MTNKFTLAQNDALVRFTLPLLGVQVPIESIDVPVFFNYRPMILLEGFHGTRFRYQERLKKIQTEKVRHIVCHFSGNPPKVVARYNIQYRLVQLYESENLIMTEPNLRILFNFMERQIAETLSDVKVERFPHSFDDERGLRNE